MKTSSKKIITKYFPFAPQIPYLVKAGRIIPKVDLNIWRKVMEGRTVTVLAFGGLLESFFSLSIIEALSQFDSKRKLYWLGNPQYNILVHSQSLASIGNPMSILAECNKKYPVPLFLDKEDGAYINCLNNYIESITYYGKYPKIRREPVLKQIFINSLVEWDMRYVPNLRGLETGEFNRWRASNRLSERSRYVLVFPGPSGRTMHSGGNLGWSAGQVRELPAMLSRFGISVIICSGDEYGYVGGGGSFRYIKDKDLGMVLNLIKNAWMVLSDDVDYLFLAMMISKASIVSRHLGGALNLQSNAEFVGSESVICTFADGIVPLDVYHLCEGMLA